MSPAEVPSEDGTESGQGGPPPLPRRLLDAFVSPGEMASYLAAHPRWAGALLTFVLLIAFSTWLVPPELFAEAQRRAALERGVDFAPLNGDTLRALHVLAVVGGAPVTHSSP